MARSKVIFGNEVLMDLTGDTITKDKLLKGYTAHGADGEPMDGECTFDVDSSEATAMIAEVLEGKTFAKGGKIYTGTMPNNEGIQEFISEKGVPYTIPQGYHDGSGTVLLDEMEAGKLIPSNIREGVTIFGVEGSMSGAEGIKAQAKAVTPTKASQTILPDTGYNYLTQVTVAGIPYVESENSAGGTTVTIG